MATGAARDFEPGCAVGARVDERPNAGSLALVVFVRVNRVVHLGGASEGNRCAHELFSVTPGPERRQRSNESFTARALALFTFRARITSMPTELFRIVDDLPGTLFTMARPQGGGWLDDEMEHLYQQGVNVVVSLLPLEEAFSLELDQEEFHCVLQGMRFLNFPITDMSVPDDVGEAEAFARSLGAQLLDGNGIAIHCRGGIGRASMMAAATLVAIGWWPDDAFRRISEKRGLTVPETQAQYNWVEDFHKRETA
jgi:protein-tyrosine phosphatase